MLVYEKNYLPYTREELIEKIRSSMSEKRFLHVLGVEKAAVELAMRYGGEVEKSSISALVHDYAKERCDEEMIAFIRANGLDEGMIPFGNNIWHGVAGSELIAQELQINDEEILQAVKVHTTGSGEMSLLDKILYVADYIEENRKFPGVEKARRIACKNLDKAVKYETKQTLTYLLEKKAPIYPKTIETYNTYVAKIKVCETCA